MISRRELLKQTGLLALFGASLGADALGQKKTSTKKRALRFAHLTDVHLEPELNAPAGLAKCLHHLQSQNDKPSFIMSGGDSNF